MAHNILIAQDVVAKLEPLKTSHHLLKHKHQVYKKLFGVIGISHVHWFGIVLPWLWLRVGLELESSLGSSQAMLSDIKGKLQLSKSQLGLRVDLELT